MEANNDKSSFVAPSIAGNYVWRHCSFSVVCLHKNTPKIGDNEQDTYQIYTFSGSAIIEESNSTFVFGTQTY